MTLDVQSGPAADARTRWFRAPHGRGLQVPLAAAAIVTAAAHVPVTGEHLQEAFYIGALFIALEVASVLLAIALIRPTRAVLLAVSAVGLLAVVAFVVSRSVGLPLITDDIGNWTEPLAEISVAAELVMAIGGAVALFLPDRGSSQVSRLGVVVGLSLLTVGCVLTVVAAGDEASSSSEMSISVGA